VLEAADAGEALAALPTARPDLVVADVPLPDPGGPDFVRRLRADASRLEVMGDGSQSKSYVLVTDVVAAVLLAVDQGGSEPFGAYNVATGDYVTVREIVGLGLEVLGLDPATVEVAYGPTNRGWKGDVPIVRLNTDRIRGLGWRPSAGSAEALRRSMEAMLADLDSD
jgi:UDP-glucose 4-epimerase